MNAKQANRGFSRLKKGDPLLFPSGLLTEIYQIYKHPDGRVQIGFNSLKFSDGSGPYLWCTEQEAIEARTKALGV